MPTLHIYIAIPYVSHKVSIDFVSALSFYSATSHCCWDVQFLFGCLLVLLIDLLDRLLEF